MNNYVKVEWRLRLQKMSNCLQSWYKQSDTAVREWSHLTEVGLQQVYHKIIYNMIKEVEAAGYRKAKLQEVIIERPIIEPPHARCKVSEKKLRRNLEVEMAHSVKLLENLEDEITKRRLMEDEIYQLKHEVRDLKSPVDSEQSSPRSFRSIQLQLSPRSTENETPRQTRNSSFTNLNNLSDRQDCRVFRSMMSPFSDSQLIQISPRGRKEEVRKQLHIALSPDVKDNMFDPKPTAIAKDFKALFDNEWTKLYADMRRYYSDQYVVDLLLSWLKDCYLTCIAITEEQRESIREDAMKCFGRYTNASLSLTLPNSCTNNIKEFQGRIASEAIPFIMKVCVRRLLSGEKNAEYPLLYIKKCAELCWLMCTQSPPMVLNMDVSHGELINRKLFTSLVPRGEMVDYLAWPAVMRYARGNMLQRGVVKTV
ncbi:uncharacterized protein LOC143043324 [Mytilus galloprovincialis]|uniref:uncharacterized protein LOC143043324 n=1 Tax=Mytilus galloprovincialis TaxID=29158 RepID=UPI003F7C9894